MEPCTRSFVFLPTFIFLSLVALCEAVCPLCETPVDLPKRWTYRVEDGRTCRDVYLDLVALAENDPECAAEKEKYQEPCCSEEEPEPVDFPPTAAPVYTGPFGDEPACPICGTMEYPGIPTGFIVARYVGEFSCDQLFYRGIHGMVPFFMCGPLQDFAEPVCGCGQYNPKCIQDPTQCWDNISQTPAPVPNPVPNPVPIPTSAPTVYIAPTVFDRKTRPQGSKYNAKLSNGAGGAAGRLRGSRGLIKRDSIEKDELPELVEKSHRDQDSH